MTPRILAFSGSARRQSLNRKLLDVAIAGAVDAGAKVTLISLLDYNLPIYDGDWEAEHGLPDGVRALQALIAEHEGLLIATPEHNGGYTALLKNAIDWLSRPDGTGAAGPLAIAGKAAALISASPGVLGGARSQIALQISLHKQGVLVIPEAFALGIAHNAFGSQGGLKDPKVNIAVRDVGAALVRLLTRHPR
jgi:NAD(P)H-dependent FMN reductase